jgi:hypothetical protein
MKKLSLNDKLDRVLLEATPAELPALLDRFQLAVKFRTQNGTPAKRTRKKAEPLVQDRVQDIVDHVEKKLQ